jgi:hypothetical protein
MSRITAAACPAVASALVLAAFGPGIAAAAPAAGAASSANIVRHYAVRVKPGVLAGGRTVRAKAVVKNPVADVRAWWSRRTIARVVRKGVNGRYEMPYASQGFQCTPSVAGQTAKFTCTLRGADVPTTVKLRFKARYAGG